MMMINFSIVQIEVNESAFTMSSEYPPQHLVSSPGILFRVHLQLCILYSSAPVYTPYVPRYTLHRQTRHKTFLQRDCHRVKAKIIHAMLSLQNTVHSTKDLRQQNIHSRLSPTLDFPFKLLVPEVDAETCLEAGIANLVAVLTAGKGFSRNLPAPQFSQFSSVFSLPGSEQILLVGLPSEPTPPMPLPSVSWRPPLVKFTL